jgi:hypothetical protein
MRATALFAWADGTVVEVPCNWNEDGSIAEGSGIAQRIYLSDEFAKAWDSDPLRFVVRSNDDPRLEREIQFDAARGAIHTHPLKLRSRSACSTPATR